jgi:lysophospholipase L1-like esterase
MHMWNGVTKLAAVLRQGKGLWAVLASAAVIGLAGTFTAPARGAEGAGLKDGDLVAVCGDSITEQKVYSNFIEDYLLMCKPTPNLRAEAFGWGGDTSWGFRDKMDRFTLPFKPTVATTCYGMNDGGYGPLTPDRVKMYHDAHRDIVKKLKAAGVRFIVLGSPGVVDSETFRKDPAAAAVYNKSLGQMKDIVSQVAQEEQVTFANLHDPMMEVMAKAKAKYGNKYDVAGPDGVHPNSNGHIVMAYAFLKAMGCDGNIGTITVDVAAKTAEATDGHKVLSADGRKIDLESTRYPFCFWGDPAQPASTTGIIEFIPFNQDLNRLTLVVKHAGSDKVKVTWGNASKEFPAADLEKGINLAAEFLDNPFVAPFRAMHDKIRNKQDWETQYIKNLYVGMPGMQKNLAGTDEAFSAIATAIEKRADAQSREVAASVAPVKHTIVIEAVK